MKNSKNMPLNSRELGVERKRQERLRQQDAMVVRADGLVKIPLTRGKWAIVDESDYELVKKYKWYTRKSKCSDLIFYAQSKASILTGSIKAIEMHRLIMNPKNDQSIDHRDGNGLNNTRYNLRFCSLSQNMWNSRVPKNNKTGFKGVSWNKKTKKYVANITKNNHQFYLGSFENSKDAALAYDQEAKKIFGEFAKPNL